MLSLSPRIDLFRFLLPDDFLPTPVRDKWIPILNKEPGVIQSPIDFLNESIRGITFPGIQDVNITQQQHSTNSIVRQDKTNVSKTGLGRINVEPNQENTYVGPKNPLDVIDREFKVTFRKNQSMANYFMVYETLFYRICKPQLYGEGEDFIIDLLNEDGTITSRIKLFQCNLQGIDSLDFSFDKTERSDDTFDCTFRFNNIDFDILPNIAL